MALLRLEGLKYKVQSKCVVACIILCVILRENFLYNEIYHLLPYLDNYVKLRSIMPLVSSLKI